MIKRQFQKTEKFGWLVLLYMRQRSRVAFEMPGLTATVVLGTLALWFTFDPNYVKSFFSFSSDIGLLPRLLFVISLMLLIILSGVIGLLRLPPEAYAKVLISGRNRREVIWVVSKHIAIVLRRFLFHERLLRERLRDIFDLSKEIGPSISEDYIVEINERISSKKRIIQAAKIWASYHMVRNHMLLQRIELMKSLAAFELGIPPRRLCDHVFRYSPAIHSDRVRKYELNWSEVLNTCDFLLTEMDGERFMALIKQNNRIIEDGKRRQSIQKRLLRYHDLYNYIVKFASTHSTSRSLQIYSSALKTCCG